MDIFFEFLFKFSFLYIFFVNFFLSIWISDRASRGAPDDTIKKWPCDINTDHILIILQSRNGHRSYLRHHHISQTNANRPKVAIIYCAGCQNFASSHTTHKKKTLPEEQRTQAIEFET